MKRRTRKYLTLLLAAVLLCSTGLLLRQYLSDQNAEAIYREAQLLAVSETVPAETTPPETVPETTALPEMRWVPAEVEEEDPHMTELAVLDLSALREVNPDVVGWIRIPGTKVDYPFLQGEDNTYYLKRTWNNTPLGAGSIFLECQNSRELTDFNTIVYGHNMNNGSMFNSIRQYAAQSYYEEHPYIYILSDAGVWRYEVFSSYRAPVDAFTYGLSFRQQETRETFLTSALESSVIETGVIPAVTDRIVTLSTCAGGGYSTRWVVHGRLAMVQVEEEQV